MKQLFLGVQDVYRTIFPTRLHMRSDGKEVEQIIFSPDEQKFIDQIRGYEMLPGNTGTRQVAPRVDASLLTRDLPASPEQDEMQRRMQQLGSLHERVEKIQHIRSGISY